MKRSLHKRNLTLRHTGNTRTNNGFFKLVEALLQTHSCFFSQNTNVRGLPRSAGHCLGALPAKMCAFNSPMQQNACYPGCSGAGTRGNGIPTLFSCFALKWVRSCFKMTSFFVCVPTSFFVSAASLLLPQYKANFCRFVATISLRNKDQQ